MMPASTFDPIAANLKSAFASGSSASSKFENGLMAAVKKTQLVSGSNSISFDPPFKHISGSGLNAALKKGTMILLNPSNLNKKNVSNGKDENVNKENNQQQSPASLPQPKVSPNASRSKLNDVEPLFCFQITFYPLSAVEVGYKKVRKAGSGMFNMGNTCYLNSTLQAVFHVPALYNYLKNENHQRHCKGSPNNFSSGCMICTVAQTLRDTEQSPVIRPSRIYEKLKLICKHLMHGRQEDAHEFLRYLIEALQKSFLVSAQAAKSLDNPSKETTPFNQIFGGYMRQDVECLQCKHVSITFQHFMDLMLDIRPVSNIDEALQHHFRTERIGGAGDDGNMYKCEKCKVKVQARKRCFIARPPVVLCIQLKRFSLLGGKISKPVQLKRRINLEKYVKSQATNGFSHQPQPELQYRLVSMITHVGPSPNCGHYTAIGEAVQNQFFQFDDSSVRPINTAQALNTASYVVFYEMTPHSKAAWIGGAGLSNETRPGPSPVPRPVPSTNGIASSSIAKPSPINKPKVITEPNKLGIVPKISLLKKTATAPSKLVPYDDDDDDDDSDEDSKSGPAPAVNGTANGSGPAKALANPFVPRAVTMKALASSGQDARPSTPMDAFRPSSSASNASDSSVTKSRSGVWSVSDNDAHAPSVASDTSNGSVSGNWTVTDFSQPKVELPAAKSAPPPPTISSTATTPTSCASSVTSTPEKRMIKRGSSIEEYEAELDRGRPKKAKIKSHSDYRESSGKHHDSGNPFQSAQNRNYNHDPNRGRSWSQGRGQNHNHSRSFSSSSSNRSNNGHQDSNRNSFSRNRSAERNGYNRFHHNNGYDRNGSGYRDKFKHQYRRKGSG